MAEQRQNLVLFVHNTFLHVRDMNEEAPKMRRSRSDPSHFSRDLSVFEVPSKESKSSPMVAVGEGHRASPDRQQRSSGNDSAANKGYVDAVAARPAPTDFGRAWKSVAAGSADAPPVAHDAYGIGAYEEEVEQQQQSALATGTLKHFVF